MKDFRKFLNNFKVDLIVDIRIIFFFFVNRFRFELGELNRKKELKCKIINLENIRYIFR